MDSPSTPDAPLLYTDLATLKNQRADFDPECSITIDNFGALISATGMREQLTCQLETPTSGRCNQPHHKGWLAKRKDGPECLIGGDCADKYFNANETFRAERHRMNHDIAVEGHLVALRELLKDRSAVQERVQQCRKRLSAYREALKELEQALPVQAVGQLRSFAKGGDRVRVDVEVQYVVDIDEEGNEERKWETRGAGEIIGLSVWDSSAVAELVRTIGAVDASRQAAVLDKHQRLQDLKLWREQLEQLPGCEQALERLDRTFEQFSSAANLSMICFLVKNNDMQRQVVEVILKRNGEQPTPIRVQDSLNRIHQHVRDQYGGNNFRLVHG